jgi:hypothetical protein
LSARLLLLWDPKSLQRLHRLNRKRAVRLLLKGEGDRCSVPAAEVERFFSEAADMEEDVCDLSVYTQCSTSRPPVDL